MRTRTGAAWSLGAVAVLALALVGATILRGAPTASSTPPATDTPVVATDVDGPFELTIRSAKAMYEANEAVEIEARLTYHGAGPAITIGHALGAGGSPMAFGVAEPVPVEGLATFDLGPGYRDSCNRTELQADEPLVTAFSKSGSPRSDASDPLFDAVSAWFREPLVLPAGVWHPYVVASFGVGGCVGRDRGIELRADIEIRVEPEVAPSASPSASPEAADLIARAAEGDFELTLRSKAQYEAGDPIDVTASYTYVGAEPSIMVSHFAPEVAFSVEQLDVLHPTEGWIRVYDSACQQLRLAKGSARDVAMVEFNVMRFVAAAPLEDLRGPPGVDPLRLPAGTWRITANLSSAMGPCTDQGKQIAVSTALELEVIGRIGAAIELKTMRMAVLLPSGGQIGGKVCPLALGGGRLARNPGTGLGFADADGKWVEDVIWPAGYWARFEDGRAVLRDPTGRFVAREGDWIRSGGGHIADKTWYACSEIEVVEPPGDP